MQDKSQNLVLRVQQGVPGAFEELMVLYQDKVFSQCYRLTGNYSDAQDLAQEVFIRAYKGLQSFRNQADLGTWLHRIAINQFLNLRRKEKDFTSISLDEPVPTEEGEMLRQVAATGEDPLELVEKAELQGLVKAALQQLMPEYRVVLVLREFEDYSYEEIAQMLECSLGTVKSRLNRGRKALKQELERLINTDER